MPDDYIKRSDAIRVIEYYEPNYTKEDEIHIAAMTIRINQIPTANVEPVKHGYYIGTEFDGYADGNPVYYEWKCSECDCIFENNEPKYRYCPNCGAKMDAEPLKEERDD